jgi:exodeoxyribonuclease V gamma subunit
MTEGTRHSLTVMVGESLDELAEHLAAHLGERHRTALESDVVVVPTPGIGYWLEERLSRRLGASLLGDGICANVECLLWGGFLRRVLGVRDSDHDEWSVGAMTLTGLALLVGDAGATAPVHAVSERPGTPAFPAARSSADLFDQLFRWRPDVADQWLESKTSDPRAGLLRDLAARASSAPPHRALADAAGRLAGGGPDPERLPTCIHLFGSDSIPGGPGAPSLLDALAVSHDVVVHLVTPSATRFQRIHAATPTWGKSPPTRSPDDDDVRDVLLVRSWGTGTADAARLVAQLPSRASTSIEVVPRIATQSAPLLATLQASIRGEVAEPCAPDSSISFHSCVGAARQVEAARDAILHALCDDPSVRPSDVAILCADLPRFAPYVEAVFGSPEGAPSIPYVLRDRSLSRASPYVAALDDAIQLIGGRLPRSVVVDLLRSEFVQRRFSLSLDDVERIASWMETAEVRWGLDGPHRRSIGLPPEFDAGTWRRALDRLLAGVAVPADAGSEALGVRPIDVGHDLDLVSGWCEVFEVLESLQASSEDPRGLASWCDFAAHVAESLLAPAADDTRSGSVLRSTLEAIRTDAPPRDVPIAYEEFKAVLADRASAQRELVATGPGGVTVTSFAPLRNVPFRVLVVLGLDESSLPPASSVDGAFGAPRIGDRDRSADARGALLAAVLSARDRLVVTYDGRDVVTNDRIAPSTALSELHDAIAEVCTDRPTALERSHPRHAHGAEDLTSGPDGGPFAFDRGALQRARELERAGLAVLGPRVHARNEADLDDHVERDDLVGFLRAPQRTFLWQTLGVRLPPRDPVPSDELPTAADGLERWKMVEELVALALERKIDNDEWAETCATWADELDSPLSCLPGRLADVALRSEEGVVKRAKLLFDAVVKFAGTDAPDALAAEATLPGGEVVSGQLAVRRGDLLLSWTASSTDAKLRVNSAVDLLLATVSHPETRWRAMRIWRQPRHKSVNAKLLSVEGDTPDERASRAAAGLRGLLDLRRRGLSEPIPLFLNVSMQILRHLDEEPDAGAEELAAAGLFGWSSMFAADDGSDPPVRYCFDGTYDDLLAMPVEPGDPVVDERGRDSRLLAYSLAFLDGMLAIEHAEDRIGVR